MIEEQYLVYQCYGVTQGEKEEDIIYRAAGKTYLDFRRRISFQGKVSVEQRRVITEKVKNLLVKELPILFQTGTQEAFDEKHHEICQNIIRIYESTGGQAYGIAQRWVNQTLLHLALIEDHLHTGYWNMKECRKYFHVPVEQYVLEGRFDAAEFASGNYVLAVGPSLELGTEYPVLPTPSAGSTVELNGRTYTVMAVVYPLNPVTQLTVQQGAGDKFNLSFIIPSDAFRQQWPDHTLRKLFLNVDDAHIDTVQSFLDEYRETTDPSLPVASRQTMAEQYESETRSSAVMGNAVSVVIALVGVLNFINSMVTAIVSRKREFAVIQSVGMTKRQLNRMLVNEGLFYAVLTLAASYLFSSLAVGVVVRGMVAGGFTTFRFTLLPLAICTPILLIFAILIPYLCFRNLETHSIVEWLRME